MGLVAVAFYASARVISFASILGILSILLAANVGVQSRTFDKRHRIVLILLSRIFPANCRLAGNLPRFVEVYFCSSLCFELTMPSKLRWQEEIIAFSSFFCGGRRITTIGQCRTGSRCEENTFVYSGTRCAVSVIRVVNVPSHALLLFRVAQRFLAEKGCVFYSSARVYFSCACRKLV